jgi:hypothetical protein
LLTVAVAGTACKSPPARTRAGEDHRTQQAEQITDRDARELSAQSKPARRAEPPPPARERQTEVIDVPLRP